MALVYRIGVHVSSSMVAIAARITEFSPVVIETSAPPRIAAPIVGYPK